MGQLVDNREINKAYVQEIRILPYVDEKPWGNAGAAQTYGAKAEIVFSYVDSDGKELKKGIEVMSLATELETPLTVDEYIALLSSRADEMKAKILAEKQEKSNNYSSNER